MKILSKANTDFFIDGIRIVPGLKNYKKIDPSKPHVKYQLGILKADGAIDFKEKIEAPGKDVMPFEKPKAPAEKAPAKKAKSNGKRDAKKSD